MKLLKQDSNLFLCIKDILCLSVNEVFSIIEKKYLYRTVVYFHLKRILGDFLYQINFLKELSISYGPKLYVEWTTMWKWKRQQKFNEEHSIKFLEKIVR